MKEFKLYQMDIEKELKFRDLPEEYETVSLNKFGYKLVYEGNINTDDNDVALGMLWEIFNINHPEDYRGSSMSVSDLVIVDGKAYYCMSMGWKEVELKV